MSLYEAMERRNLLEKKIANINIRNANMVAAKKKNDDVLASGVSVEDAKKEIQSRYDSTIALVNNFIALKSAINDANAKITITVAGEEMSLANAIVRKRELGRLKTVWQEVKRIAMLTKEGIAKDNEKNLTDDAANTAVSKMLNDGSKKDPALIKMMKEDYIKKTELEFYDPLNLTEKADAELDRLEKFESEIHFAMTAANVQNTITVNFE
jgi:hypothetical protein